MSSSDQTYDVAIVGASFAGLMAAITASSSNRVLLIEKRRRPGSPVNTTGAVPIEWLKKAGVFPPAECIAGNLRGVELIAPNGQGVKIMTRNPDTAMLHPDAFVGWMADKARDRGCTILTNTVFRGVSGNNGAQKEHRDGDVLSVSTSSGTFRSRYVIGADGAASNVGLSVGLGARPAAEDLHIGLEITVQNNQIQDPEVYRIYFGHNVAPLGYAWSFPEGANRLRVGLGIPKSLSIPAVRMLDRFLSKYPEFDTPVTKSNGGIIPTAPPLKTAVKGNVVLVGDAGHFCSPLHGGGIWFGMLSGQLAGIALAKGDPEMYDRLWKAELGGVLSRHYKLKRVIGSMTDENFNDLINMMQAFLAAGNREVGLARKLPAVFFSDPGFFLEMAMKSSRQGLTLDVIKRMLIPSFRIA